MSAKTIPDVVPGRPTFQQTMLRIANPTKSIKFYRDMMGMTLIDIFDFPQYEFSLYFLATLPEGTDYTLTPGTKEAHDYLWTYDGSTLELTHNHGTEEGDFAGYHVGNQEKDGFGHIAFNCNDIREATDKLLAQGVDFKKKPDEGRMKNIAFAYDPDGYWVELVTRSNTVEIPSNYFNLSQCMIRVKNPKKTIPFYQSLGMSLIREIHFNDFSLYYLATGVEAPDDTSSGETMGNFFGQVLELTHNHGTENDDDYKLFNGNEDNRKGFGHVGFLVDDVYKACDALRPMGYGFKKEPDGGSMKGLAFAFDPDGYWVEIVPRGGLDFGDKRKV